MHWYDVTCQTVFTNVAEWFIGSSLTTSLMHRIKAQLRFRLMPSPVTSARLKWLRATCPTNSQKPDALMKTCPALDKRYLFTIVAVCECVLEMHSHVLIGICATGRGTMASRLRIRNSSD